ncbi:MAG: methyltransferase domain-containing protein, partial [Anaerolineales bacterium]
MFDKVLRWIDSERPNGVLELGCGLGYLGSEIADRFGARVTGLDLSEQALTMAADRHHRPSFLRSDAINLPFTSGSFDCVLAVNLVEHLDGHDQQSLISEARRVLRPEGFLIISTPDPRSIYARIMIRDATHARELKREEFLELMESRLGIEEVCYTNSIGRLSSTANDVLSALFPADILVRASWRNAKTGNYFEDFLKVYPASHALARGCEAMALSGANMQDPVMDIGCGDGSFMKVISGPYEIAVGVDRDRSVMKEARKTGRYRSLVVCDAESLPFRSNSLRTIVSNSVFEHLENLSAALKESKRVLRVGGELVLSVPNPRSDEWWHGGQQWVRLKTLIWRHKNLIFEQQWKSKIEKA